MKTSLTLLCLALAGSSSAAFAIRQPTPRVFGYHSTQLREGAADDVTDALSDGASAVKDALRGGADAVADLKAPPALYQGAVAAGAAKAAAPFGKIFKLGIVAGCHIAFGAYLAISVGGACPGLASTNPGLQKIVLVRSFDCSFEFAEFHITMSRTFLSKSTTILQ